MVFKNIKKIIISRSSFTLMELLIVIGILAVISTVAVIALNPVEYLKQARDSQRLSELQSINKALGIFEIQSPGASMGNLNTVYVSLPSANSNCSGLGLPLLPSGWAYQCVTTSSLKNINGTGWLPVDFSSLSIGSPFSLLPIDPSNSVSNLLYYTYIPGGSWELTSTMESVAYGLGGSKDVSGIDGGDNVAEYEIGSDLALSPWSLEFNAPFATTTSATMMRVWKIVAGATSSSWQADGDDRFLRANGYLRAFWQENIPFDPNALYEITCRVRQISDPTTGGKGVYCGWVGVAADGITLVNVNGDNSTGSQHYHAAANSQPTTGAGYINLTGYTKGYNATGNSGPCTNPLSPCKVNSNVKYLRPYFFLNYNTGDGVADLDYIRINVIK